MDSRPAPSRLPLVFAAALALSAFLLFAVQPLFGRLALPRLGGAPAVWNTALVFFQAALLAGYAYAHALARLAPVRAQIAIHAAVLAGGAAVLPLALPAGLAPPDGVAPAPWLLGLMAATIGPPFLALSANAPLLQAWYVRATGGARDPYPLYAASNAGSFAALLAYPAAIEPLLALGAQSLAWTVAYAGAALLIAGCGLVAARAPAPAAAAPKAGPVPAHARERLAWMALAAVPSSLLLGVTQHITTDIAAIPLFWVAPLALYLLTFVVAFARADPPGRAAARFAVPYAVAVLAFTSLFGGNRVVHLGLHLAAFVVLALAAHTELAARRPAASRLTEFYLCVSAGGALGGAATALLAPALFPGVWEYPLAIAAACLIGPRDRGAAPRAGSTVAIAVGTALVGGGLAVGHFLMRDPGVAPLAIVAVAAVIAVGLFALRTRRPALALGAAAALLLAPQTEMLGAKLFQARSFFGVHRVVATPDGRHRLLLHGTTMHNAETVDPGAPPTPLAYHLRDGPAGTAIAALAPRLAAGRVGVIGLGGGALACHARDGQRWTFYEIDPTVVRIARDRALLRSLSECGAGTSVVTGDGRLMLLREPPGAFALMIIDAFSSDSIPVHLLTREAIRLFVDRLAPDGVLLFHLSNRYLRLDRVVIGVAAAEGLALRINWHAVEPVPGAFRASSLWAALARDPATLAPLADEAGWRDPDPALAVRAWSDDYANLLAILR